MTEEIDVNIYKSSIQQPKNTESERGNKSIYPHAESVESMNKPSQLDKQNHEGIDFFESDQELGIDSPLEGETNENSNNENVNNENVENVRTKKWEEEIKNPYKKNNGILSFFLHYAYKIGEKVAWGLGITSSRYYYQIPYAQEIRNNENSEEFADVKTEIKEKMEKVPENIDLVSHLYRKSIDLDDFEESLKGEQNNVIEEENLNQEQNQNNIEENNNVEIEMEKV